MVEEWGRAEQRNYEGEESLNKRRIVTCKRKIGEGQ